MNIVIFGSYNGSSIGDTAILIGLISSLHRVFGEKLQVSILSMGEFDINEELRQLDLKVSVRQTRINVIGSGSGKFSSPLQKIWQVWSRLRKKPALNRKKIKESLDSADLLIIGGGNLIMDLFPAWPRILKLICDLAISQKVPYGFAGVGAGPIKSASGKSVLSECVSGAGFVAFRDFKSKKYCSDVIGFDDSIVGPDLAFGIEWSPKIYKNEKNTMVLNLAPVYSKFWPENNEESYRKYIQGMSGLVKSLIRKFGVSEVLIINSNFPLDERAVVDFLDFASLEQEGVDVNYFSGRRSVFELLNVCSSSSLAVVTRLHSGIIAYLSGVPVLAVAYQPKVIDVMEEQMAGSKIITMSDLLVFDDSKEIDYTPMRTGLPGAHKIVDVFLNNLLARAVSK